jgi:hypothetical protein
MLHKPRLEIMYALEQFGCQFVRWNR